jgi:hypothetical protein
MSFIFLLRLSALTFICFGFGLVSLISPLYGDDSLMPTSLPNLSLITCKKKVLMWLKLKWVSWYFWTFCHISKIAGFVSTIYKYSLSLLVRLTTVWFLISTCQIDYCLIPYLYLSDWLLFDSLSLLVRLTTVWFLISTCQIDYCLIPYLYLSDWLLFEELYLTLL